MKQYKIKLTAENAHCYLYVKSLMLFVALLVVKRLSIVVRLLLYFFVKGLIALEKCIVMEYSYMRREEIKSTEFKHMDHMDLFVEYK